MLKQLTAVILAATLTCLSMAAQAAPGQGETDKQARQEGERTQKIKAQAQRIGAGEQRKVRVEMKDKTQLAGYISKVDADSFTVTDTTGKGTPVAYSDVLRIKKKGLSGGVGTGIGIAIGAVIVAAVVTIVVLVQLGG